MPEGATARLGKGSISDIAYSPDGARLAVASTIGVWIYDAHTGAEIALLTGHTRDWSQSVAFSPDGGTLAGASGSWDGTIHLWDAVTGEHGQTLEGHTGNVTFIAFSPDGGTLAGASGSWDGTIHLWDAVTGEHGQTLEGHTDNVTSIAFSPDGGTLASGSWDHTIRLWNAVTGAQVQTLKEDAWVSDVAFSPDEGYARQWEY